MLTQEQIVKKEIDGSHYYFVNGEFYPGVTTILDQAAPMPYSLRNFLLENTKESAQEIKDVSTGFGSRMHDAYARLLGGLELDLLNEYKTTREKKHILSFVSWFQEMKPKVLGIEQIIASEKYRFAGTLDLVCEIQGLTWIIDFKTSSGLYYNYDLQLTAYKQAYEEMMGAKIDAMALVRTGTRHKATYEFKRVNRDFAEFKNVYDTYLSMNDGKIPNPPMIDVYPDTIRLETV